jgi:hypothetical protein
MSWGYLIAVVPVDLAEVPGGVAHVSRSYYLPNRPDRRAMDVFTGEKMYQSPE